MAKRSSARSGAVSGGVATLGRQAAEVAMRGDARVTLAMLTVAAGLSGAATAAPGQPGAASSPYPPVPQPRSEPMPASLGRGRVWEPGHWRWDGGAYAWEPGRSVVRRARYSRFVPGHWVPHRAGWVWMPAHWQ